MEILRKYNVSTTVYFPLIDAGAADFESTPVTFASGDTQISKDGGAFANTTNNPAHEGNGIYSLVLTATEMQAALIQITIIDSATKAWEDQSVLISTYGNASAQHAFDLDTASTAQTGDSFARLGTPAGASIAADLLAIDNFVDELESRLTAVRAGYLDNLNGHTPQTGDSYDRIGANGAGLTALPWNAAWDAEVQSEVDDALVAHNLDHLVGTATGIPAVPAGTYLDQIMDDGTASYDRTTDSLQAIRDRGDTSWITGGGGGITDILNITPLIPPSVDLANTAGWRLGFMFINSLDDLPSTAEITPGTIDIDRKAIGATTWTNVVSGAACSELAGLIYYEEAFASGDGYAEGDSIRITFKSQKITVSANDYEISDANGRVFYTEIRQTMRGTDGANTTTPPTAVQNRQEMDSNSTQLAAIVADTGEIGTAGAGLTDLGGMSTAMKDEVNAEVLDVANVDIYGEPGQGAPGATISIFAKINYLYKWARNKWDNDGTTIKMYDDAGTTVDHKRTVSEAAGTVTKEEIVSGP